MSGHRGSAVVVNKLGQPEDLSVEEVNVGEPGKGQVLIEVMCAGVNFPDVLIIQGKYQNRPKLPFSPGGEISGIVRKLGPGVSGLREGDRVLAIMGWGGFAQWAVVDAPRVVKIPDAVDFATASGFTFTYGTTYHAFKQRAQLKKGESVLILGAAGGVGLAAVELAKAMGASKIIAAASTDEKLEICKRFGATHTINYARDSFKDCLKEIVGSEGVDVVYDPVGDKYAEPAIRALAWNGRYLVIGFAGGEIPKIPLNLYLLKGASAVGVFWGRFTSMEPAEHSKNTSELLTMIANKQLRPLVSNQYPLSDAPRALRDMMERKVTGKAVIVCSPAANGARL